MNSSKGTFLDLGGTVVTAQQCVNFLSRASGNASFSHHLSTQTMVYGTNTVLEGWVAADQGLGWEHSPRACSRAMSPLTEVCGDPA